MSKQFFKSKPIFPQQLSKQMNISVFFVCDVNISFKGKIQIAVSSIYRLFDNGKFIGYGPTRGTHDYYRVDQYELTTGNHHLVIELSHYGCNNYYFPNVEPFFQCEVYDVDQLIKVSKDFTCYQNTSRFQKVSRFSFQRGFIESYHFESDIQDFYLGKVNPFCQLECCELNNKKYLDRNVNYPKFLIEPFELFETGTVTINQDKEKYRDRFMLMDHIGIFPIEEWQDNPNDQVSLFDYHRENINKLGKNTFFTYRLNQCFTGFINIDIKINKKSKIFLIFDEIDSGHSDELTEILFYRNTTDNIVTYELDVGTHRHISFEAYTMRYLRIIVEDGDVIINSLELIRYENPLEKKIEYHFNNEKVQRIFDAGIATFAQNAVDILTDCPSRERAGWLCDSFFSSKSEQMITGENLVEHNFLENYALFKQSSFLPLGMIPMCYPGDHVDGVYIPNWAMFYILELNDYASRTNDQELIGKSLYHVKNLIDFFAKYENEYGLLENLDSWVFVEWSRANDNDFISGVNFPSNMLYSETLIAAGKLLNDSVLINKGKTLKNTIKEMSFNGEFFVDNMNRDETGDLTLTSHITETCQYYAFYFNVANKHEYPQLFKKIVNEFGPKRDIKNTYPDVYPSNVFIGDYLRLCILLRYNMSSQVGEETIDYFDKMALLTGTLWEHDSTFASLNHCFASYIINILLNAYFGLVYIDCTNKVIYLRHEHLNQDAEVVIPCCDEKIKLINNAGQEIYTFPIDYEVKYLDDDTILY
ncbi:MAG: hypothetical protein PUA56_05415 [Bacillales bacterium]|nr:hypothetical protein [Bacillales bacterium]